MKQDTFDLDAPPLDESWGSKKKSFLKKTGLKYRCSVYGERFPAGDPFGGLQPLTIQDWPY